MNTLELAKKLIACPSITPEDAGCQTIIRDFLTPLGFQCETLRFEDVTNLWAITGTQKPLLVFAGHTDVVPPGPLEKWDSPPFTPTIRDGALYGRGAADMKSSIAAMMIAARDFVTAFPKFEGSIGFLITSDEEGLSINGTRKVVEWLTQHDIQIDSCLVGEASSQHTLADVVKVGRRGSLHAQIQFHGKQGHVAYPNLAENAIHLALSPLQALTETVWDNGNEFFPPTSMQIVEIQGGAGAMNIVPGECQVKINWRFNTCFTAESLQEKITSILQQTGVRFTCHFSIGAEPFLSKPATLTQSIVNVSEKIIGVKTQLKTDGGTSDGRFIAPTGAEVVELGPRNASIHQVNEHVHIAELEQLTVLYFEILKSYFGV